MKHETIKIADNPCRGSPEPEKILFVTLSCVGDVVMTTPILESLHKKFPFAVVDIVADRRSSKLFDHCPYRGEIFIKYKHKFLRGAVRLLKDVGKKKYDLIVDLRTDFLVWFFRGRKRLTKWNRLASGEHAVEQFMGVIRCLHGDDKIPPAKIWLSEHEHAFAATALTSLPPGKWLAFAPGTALVKKAWPVSKYIGLANSLRNRVSGIILEGSPGERAVTTAVADGLDLPYVNLAGKTNLLQAAAVLDKADLFIGSDSGLGHIAAAMSVPTITFFSVDRPERVLPWGKKAACLLAKDSDAGTIPVNDAERLAVNLLQEQSRAG